MRVMQVYRVGEKEGCGNGWVGKGIGEVLDCGLYYGLHYVFVIGELGGSTWFWILGLGI